MLSSKEKRLSHAPPEVYPNLEGPAGLGPNQHVPTSYGVINNHFNNIKDSHLKKLLNDRNSHSLSHEFSQIYISNLKSNAIGNHTQGKKVDTARYDHLPKLEEINSYKKEANEAKKQMFQMEKSIRYWSDCTEYWRNKWRKSRDEKNKCRDEGKQLKSRITRLENQLRVSEEKRTRLSDEVNMLNEELSRYMYRFAEDEANNANGRVVTHKSTKHQLQSHYNSDRRVDYRRHRRKLETPKESSRRPAPTGESSSSDLEVADGALARPDEMSRLFKDQSSLPKIVYRAHERLFDKKIVNKKRFSQVVMLDEDEILQMNQEIPTMSPTVRSNDNTLKASNNHSHEVEGSSFHDPQQHYYSQQRLMEYVPEEESEKEEEDSFNGRIRRGLFLGGDLKLEAATSNTVNHSNLSTMATNSECANVGSVSQDISKEDQHKDHSPDQSTEGAPDIDPLQEDDDDDEV